MKVHQTSFHTSLSLESKESPTEGQPVSVQHSPRARRVIHVSASDSSGGAARGAFRLHQTLVNRGANSRMFVLNQESDESTIDQYHPPEAPLKRVYRTLRKEYIKRAQAAYQKSRPSGCEHFRDDRSPFGKEVWRQIPPADIINLHWVADFIDYRNFFPLIPSHTSLVWTMHDMNPFTGGCHYDLGCGRFESKCGACPQLGSARENDLSRAVHQRKEKALATLSPDRVRIIAGSHWLASQARKSSLLSRFDIRAIHYGIDTSSFRPRDRTTLRTALEIPHSAFVVLFAADHLKDERKGLSFLLKALRQLPRDRQTYLLSVGHGNADFSPPFPHIHLGYLISDEMLSVFYSAGDCFVIPSLQEVFGLTALEAMACATPVVGFATGGIPEMVRPGETGLLATTGNTHELAAKIQWVMEHPDESRTMGEKARFVAEKEFSVARQARLHEEVYDELADCSARNHSEER